MGGVGKRMENSGFYFHLEDGKMMLGIGFHIFPKEFLERYRDAVVNHKFGPKLKKAVSQLAKKNYEVKGKHYKRIPLDFDGSHENADFLLYNGMHSGIEMKVPKEFFSKELVDFSFKHYLDMLPLHEWLREAVVIF